MSLAFPALRQESCVRFRFRYSECGRCASACPHAAIGLGEDGMAIDAAKCRNCALCAAACPTEALSSSHVSAETLLARAAAGATLSVACAPSGEVADTIVPCLGALDTTLIAALATRDVALELRGAGHCGECEHGPVGASRLDKQLEAVRALHAAAQPPAWTPPTLDSATVPDRHTVHDGARRQLFRRMFGKGLDAMAEAAEPVAERLAAPLKAVRVVSSVRVARRERLQAVLAASREGTATVEARDDLPCADLEIDASRCNACEACARVCPTGALDISESGVGWALAFRPSRCVGCGVCVETCQRRALGLARAATPARLASRTPVALHSLGKSRCPRCDRFFLSVEGAGHCATCRGDDHDFDSLFG